MNQLLNFSFNAVKPLLCFFFLLLCSVANVSAQQISGTIKDDGGGPLVGASVLVKGTSNGTVTDANGAFKLANVAKGSTLVVSFVGFVNQEISADGASFDIVLKEGDALGEVIVTGVFDARTRLAASSAISIMKTKDIERVAATSGMDYLKNIPGVFVSSGRGEIGNQIAVRGLSQFPGLHSFNFVSMQEDGLPITNINYATDYYLRPDVTTGRVEAMRGGSSSITTANAPGGIFNYISKTGGDKLEGEARVKLGLEGDGRNLYARTDLGFGGPLSKDKSLTFYVGGFYRNSRGARYAGYAANNGGQIKGNIVKTYKTGSLKLFVKVLSDKNQQAAFTPTEGWATQNIPVGFNYTDSYDVPAIQLQMPRNGRIIDFDTKNKFFSRENNVGLAWTQELGAGFTLKNSFKYTDKKMLQQNTNIASTIDPATAGFYGLPSLSNRYGVYTFTDMVTGKVLGTFDRQLGKPIVPGASNSFPGINNKVMFMPAFMTERNSNDMMDQISVSKQLNNMRFTAGGYFAKTFQTIDGSNTGSGPGAATIQDRPHMIDIKLASTDGKTYQVTSPSGFTKLDEAGQNTGELNQNLSSLFFAHDWQITPRLNLDWGVRQESVKNYGWNAATVAINGGDAVTAGGTDSNPLTLYDNFGGTQGTKINYAINAKYTSVSAGLNFKIADNQAVFFRYSRGGKSVDVNSIYPLNSQFVVDNTVSKDLVQRIEQIELSYKYSSDNFKLFVTPFMSKLGNVANVQFFRNVDNTSYSPIPQFNSFETQGIEIEGDVKLNNIFSLRASALFQKSNAKVFKTWLANANGAADDVLLDFSGNNTGGVPPVMFNLAPSINVDKFFAILSYNHLSERPANTPNGWTMKGYNNVDLSMGYSILKNLSVQFNVNNLLNQQGILEWLAPGNFPANTNRDRITKEYVAGAPANDAYSALRNMPRAYFLTVSYKF